MYLNMTSHKSMRRSKGICSSAGNAAGALILWHIRNTQKYAKKYSLIREKNLIHKLKELLRLNRNSLFK